MMFKVGDKVECIHDGAWQNEHQERDAAKAQQLDRRFFMGNASAYMHTDEAYVVDVITETGGLRLRGFCPTVSPQDVHLSEKPVIRERKDSGDTETYRSRLDGAQEVLGSLKAQETTPSKKASKSPDTGEPLPVDLPTLEQTANILGPQSAAAQVLADYKRHSQGADIFLDRRRRVFIVVPRESNTPTA